MTMFRACCLLPAPIRSRKAYAGGMSLHNRQGKGKARERRKRKVVEVEIPRDGITLANYHHTIPVVFTHQSIVKPRKPGQLSQYGY